MKVRRPEPGDRAVARRIRAAALDYLTPASEIAAQQAEGRRRAEAFRKGMEAIANGDGPPAPAQQPGDAQAEAEQTEAAPQEKDRSKGPRSKHFQPPIARSEEGREGSEQ